MTANGLYGKVQGFLFTMEIFTIFKKTSEIFLENTALANAATVFFSFFADRKPQKGRRKRVKGSPQVIVSHSKSPQSAENAQN